MSRGRKGFLAGLAVFAVSLVFVVAGAASAQTSTAGPVAGEDNLAPGPVSGLVTEVDLAAPSVTLTWVLSGDDFVRQVPASGVLTPDGVFVNTNDVAGYEIWRTVLGGTAELITTVAAGGTTYTDATVQSGSTYTYELKAVDAAANASTAVASEPVSLGPPPEASIILPAGIVGDTLAFGEVAADEVGTKQFIISNVATATDAGTLRVTAVVTGDGFAADAAIISIARGSVDTLTISFDAAAAGNLNGSYAGVLTISTNDPNTLVTTYQLTTSIVGGLGPAVLDLSAIEIGFAQVTVDSTSERLLTIRNTGDLELTGTLAVSGTGEFTISETAFALAADAAVDITVSFTPADTVLYEATITITSNDPEKAEVIIPLSGRGSAGGRVLVGEDGLPIYGDLDGDASVTFDDFFAFADAFGAAPGSANWVAGADFDGNGEVNFDDFFTFADNFGKSGTYVGG